MYKVELYVEKCLRCLEDQDIPRDEFEIICINDGSPDNCREIVIRFQKEYDNIILIDQENQGVSSARNNGIDRATGKYLLFIDPDDFVDTKSFKRVLNKADEHQAQVSFLGFTVLNENDTIRSKEHNEKFADLVKSGPEAYLMTHIKGRTDPDRIYGVLFISEFINKNKLRFLSGVPYLEDGEFNTRILCLAEKCVFIEGSFYWRTIRPGSATNSGLFNTQYAYNGFIKSAVNLRNFRDSMPLSNTQKVFMNQPIVKFVVLSIASTGKLSKFRKFLQVYFTLRENKFLILDLEGCNEEYKKLGGLYNVSPLLLYHYLVFRPVARFFRIF